MYEAFFGFQEKPFHVTADPSFFYPSRQHREAMAHLRYGIRERLGFLVITGEVGTGKTTLAKALLNELRGPIRTALILNPALSGAQLLRTILQDFGQPAGTLRGSRGDLLRSVEHLLLEQMRNGATAVLVVDEAQILGSNSLEQIRLLSNVETTKAKLLQIVLMGQPELAHRLRSEARLRALQERIAVRYHIQALDSNDVAAYIEHRLRIAGPDSQVRFTESAISRISELSAGIPRRINLLCDQALLAGFVRESQTIDDSLIEQARWVVTQTESPGAVEWTSSTSVG